MFNFFPGLTHVLHEYIYIGSIDFLKKLVIM